MKRNGDLYHRVRRGWAPRAAWTLLHWTFVRHKFASAELIAHEYRHVWQWRQAWYVGFAVAYPLEFFIRILVELAQVRRRSRLRGLLDRAYHKISWEVDAYSWGKRNAHHFDALRWPR